MLCHNPSNTDISQRPNADVPADQTLPPQGVNFNLLVHRIHTGANLPANRPYVVARFPVEATTILAAFCISQWTRRAHLAIRAKLRCAPSANSSEPEPARWTERRDRSASKSIGNPAAADHLWRCTGCHVDNGDSSPSTLLAIRINPGESCPVCHASSSAYAVDQGACAVLTGDQRCRASFR